MSVQSALVAIISRFSPVIITVRHRRDEKADP